MEHDQSAQRQLALPTIVFGLAAVHQLGRELERLQDFMREEEIRQPGQQAALPKLSRSLDELAAHNRLNLLQAEHRDLLQRFLAQVAKQAPTIHISFASEPSAAFTGKIVTWLRANVHPVVLVQVGLQPTIAAGCIVRTPNKVFDMSLRHRLDEKTKTLLAALEEDAKAQVPETAQVPAETKA